MREDYYELLDLSPSATPEQIKTAYRRLAKQWHPDLNQSNSAAAEEHFKLISEAYRVLSDEVSRRKYDTSRHRPVPRADLPEELRTMKRRPRVSPLYGRIRRRQARERARERHRPRPFLIIPTHKMPPFFVAIIWLFWVTVLISLVSRIFF